MVDHGSAAHASVSHHGISDHPFGYEGLGGFGGGHATHEAIEIGFFHGASAHQSLISHIGPQSSVTPATVGIEATAVDRQGNGTQPARFLDLLHSKNRPGDTFRVRVSYHGQFDNPMARLEPFLKSLGLERRDGIGATFSPLEKHDEVLNSWNHYNKNVKDASMPTGYYPGAPGRSDYYSRYGLFRRWWRAKCSSTPTWNCPGCSPVSRASATTRRASRSG